MKTTTSLSILIGLFFFNSSVYSQWSTNSAVNNAICTATGNQDTPSIASDGSGGAIITWEDRRTGTFRDIYCQRIDASGIVQWTTNGIAICTAIGNQWDPQIISDGSGGAIIAWSDSRGSSQDIYVQRINASGVVQWTADGVLICSAANDQKIPTLVTSGSGGAIITWNDYRNNTDDNIYAQLVNGSGVAQWTADGVAICSAIGEQYYPMIISDGSDGAIITWDDYRGGVADDIYAQRINSSGLVQWTTDGVGICTSADGQSHPMIIADGSGGAIITWPDIRNGVDHNIYAQRINGGGIAQWTSNGVAMCTATEGQGDPTITSNGSGGAIITWYDFRSGSGSSDIYVQAVNASGTVQWTANGVLLCAATGYQTAPTIVSDGSGGAIITWDDLRQGAFNDIYAQYVNASGTVQWAADGIAVSNASGSQYIPKIISNGTGGVIITWHDIRAGNYDIYAQRILNNVSIDEQKLILKSVYPNPTSDQFTIELNELENVEMTVVDYSGRIIEQRSGCSDYIRFGSKYVSGVYIITLRSGNASKVFKVVKS